MPRPEIAVRAIGHEGQPLVIIDHFASDPEGVRALAVQQDYRALGDYYPGIRAPVPPAYFAAVSPLIAGAMQRVFGYSGRADVDRAFFSIVTQPSDQLSLAQRVPHIDGLVPGVIAMLHYLVPDDDADGFGGTAFFRHRSTGYETIDAARHPGYIAALERDFDRCGEPPSAYISGSTDIFEEIDRVEPRYNRAILYPGSLLHCAALPNGLSFPASASDGRLTVASFFSAR